MRPWRGAGVYLGGGFVHLTAEQIGQCLDAAADGLVDGDACVLRWFLQHPAYDGFFVSGVANADFQAPILVAAQLRMNVAQAIVSRMAATVFEFGLLRRDVELVMRDQDLLRLNFKKTRQCSDRFA